MARDDRQLLSIHEAIAVEVDRSGAALRSTVGADPRALAEHIKRISDFETIFNEAPASVSRKSNTR